ncbi:TauD/TfdA family dioxygenase [Allokutzneria sp. NRRL B-24872]|uniref:TauD/TfdA family dioxygenase n=1 Tax=Allokutzneria sp. NRRL B-24872 TaxID=1137961 RepID=UPI000A3AB11D|nr:TauD/TfdA family dioxygenase [Allokutzneria sp. NRRL B-24872]
MDTLNSRVEEGKPAIVEVSGVADAAGWAERNRDALHEVVAHHGAVLVRGLGLSDVDGASAVLRTLGVELMAEREAFATRDSHGEGVYSSSKWPPNQPMCMHHELSYALEFPGLMLFACLTAPTEGGATALADSAKVLAELPGDLVERFEREGWLLNRCYNEEIGLSWTEAFGTTDKAEVERYCSANGISFEWISGGGLRTSQRRSAVIAHPGSGERLWFNQIAFLNQWTMATEIREYLVDVYGQENLPFNTSFGEGGEITQDVVEVINKTYDSVTLREPWRAGDLMLVDNLRTAHSREVFDGPREVLVALGRPTSLPA